MCVCMCDILLTCVNYHDRVGCVDRVCNWGVEVSRRSTIVS